MMAAVSVSLLIMRYASYMGMGPSSIAALDITVRKRWQNEDVGLLGRSCSITEPFISQEMDMIQSSRSMKYTFDAWVTTLIVQ